MVDTQRASTKIARRTGTGTQVLAAIAGGLMGAVSGFFLTIGLVVLKARFGYYIFAMHDLAEFRPEAIPPVLGLLAGGFLGARYPRAAARALLRGFAVAIVAVPVGFLVGMLIWDGNEGGWAGATILSSVALPVATCVALWRAKTDHLWLPDLVAGGVVVAALLIALVVGLRDPEAVDEMAVDPAPMPPPSAVDQVIFIVGDAGATIADRSPLLRALRGDVERWSRALARESAVSVLYPGDLVYPVGVRDRDHPEFETDSTRLWNQINLVAGPEAQSHRTLGLFQTGNHDWGNTGDDSGFDHVNNLEEQLGLARDAGVQATLLPEAGSPGPAVRDLRDNVRMILLDTHWFLRTRASQERTAFIAELEEAVVSAEDRHVILSAHHPYRSAGPHGAIVPGFHAWGVGYLLRRAGALVQDLNSPAYSGLLEGMRRVFERAEQRPLMYIGGHDHSLQVLEAPEEVGPAFTLVSGSGSKVSSIRTLEGMHYGAARPGYMMLLLKKDGSVDLFVVAGAPELLTCDADDQDAVERCMVRGEALFDIVYGQTLATAPDRPVQTGDRTAAEARRAEGSDTEETDQSDGEVANVNTADAPEPVAWGELAWWTRQRIPEDSEIAEDDESVAAPPPAVPARILYFRPDTVMASTGASYSAGVLERFVLGDLNRHLWDVPFPVPVIDLDTLGGGVEPTELTGGKQTLGVMLRGQDGREYQFRAIVKDASRALPGTMEDGAIDDVLQDQLAAQFPLAAMVVVELLEEVGVLVAKTTPVVLPHDERLGLYRPFFGGRMGWLEVKPNEREDGGPGFASSTKIVDGDEIYDELTEPGAFADVRMYLRTRMIDFLVGDWDRHSDNLRWASFTDGERVRWEPIPNDRDWAFARTGGLPSRLSGTVMPRFVGFGPDLPPAERIAEAGDRIDHLILGGVPASVFVEEAEFVSASMTPEVIDRALSVLPDAFEDLERPGLDEALLARAAELPRMGREFHAVVNEFVHVWGFEDLADTMRFEESGGSLSVAVFTEGSNTPRIRWVLDPAITSTVEVFLEPEVDHLVVPDGFPIEVIRTDPDVLEPDEGGGRAR